MTSEETPQVDQPRSEQVKGDKITIGDISESTSVAVDRGATATVTEGSSVAEVAVVFDPIYQEIESRSVDLDVDKEELTETVQKIQNEVVRGEQANGDKVERWLKFLALMATDIFEVTAATLANPAAGVAAVIRKVAQKAMEEQGQA